MKTECKAFQYLELNDEEDLSKETEKEHAVSLVKN